MDLLISPEGGTLPKIGQFQWYHHRVCFRLPISLSRVGQTRSLPGGWDNSSWQVKGFHQPIRAQNDQIPRKWGREKWRKEKEIHYRPCTNANITFPGVLSTRLANSITSSPLFILVLLLLQWIVMGTRAIYRKLTLILFLSVSASCRRASSSFISRNHDTWKNIHSQTSRSHPALKQKHVTA